MPPPLLLGVSPPANLAWPARSGGPAINLLSSCVVIRDRDEWRRVRPPPPDGGNQPAGVQRRATHRLDRSLPCATNVRLARRRNRHLTLSNAGNQKSVVVDARRRRG